MNRNKSGISPVMATVILVAIAIVIAIAVAFWASGLVGVFTRFEKMEVTTAMYDTTNRDVELLVRNTGSSAATIDNIYVNGQPVSSYTLATDGDVVHPPIGAATCDTSGTCDPGEYIVVSISSPTGGWAHGVTYEFAIHTASGKTYPVSVLIP